MTRTNFPNGITSQGAPVDGNLGFPLQGTRYYVNPATGSDGNTGLSVNQAFLTLGQALTAATADQHDVIYILGGDSGLSESVTVSKDYVHLVGVAAPVFNSRARISAPSGAADNWMTFSANGNIVTNIRIGAFVDVNVNCLVSGDRLYFENVTFQGGGDATAADDANMRSLKVTGSENRFKDSTIGVDTQARANVASAELELSGTATRNTFEDCLFTKSADGVGNLFVKTVGTSAVDRWTRFHNCTWYSFWANDADKITAAFNVSSQTATGHFLMTGRQVLVGADDWEASASGRLYFEPYTATANALGLAINPAVS